MPGSATTIASSSSTSRKAAITAFQDEVKAALTKAGYPAAADPEQMVLTINRSLKSLSSVVDARKELDKSRTEDKGWGGFTEKPPYSILTLDELLNERDAAKAKLSSREATLRNIERLAVTSIQETKAAETDVGERMLAVQDALMPGLRHIAVQNYAEVNDAPIAARAVLAANGRKGAARE